MSGQRVGLHRGARDTSTASGRVGSSTSRGHGLQRQFGNRAVVEMMRVMHGAGAAPSAVVHAGTLASVHGLAEGQFNGGPWSVPDQKLVRAKGCDCADGEECISVTGTVVAKYKVAVTITMPDVPAGLTPCEEATMRRWIGTTLRAHENEHKRRLETYNGTTNRRISLKGCSTDALFERIGDQQKAESEAREKKAADYSALIDPFDVDIPNTCKD